MGIVGTIQKGQPENQKGPTSWEPHGKGPVPTPPVLAGTGHWRRQNRPLTQPLLGYPQREVGVSPYGRLESCQGTAPGVARREGR
jgi:hypothetical protein